MISKSQPKTKEAPGAVTPEASKSDLPDQRKADMTHSITNITPDNVPELTYKGVPVVISSVLAQLYGTDIKNIQKNYKRNESRFELGKHYFKIEGNELKELKKQPSLRGLLSKMVSHLILWTERGSARHAKMLETDAAWDVFEALEDNYFDKLSHSQDENTLPDKITKTTTQDRAPLKQLVNTIVDARTRRGHPSDYSSAWREINGYLGLESIQDATHDQIETGIAFARKILEGELCSPQAALPDQTASLTIDSPRTKHWSEYTVGELIGEGVMHFETSKAIRVLRRAAKSGAPINVKEMGAIEHEIMALRHITECTMHRNQSIAANLFSLHCHAEIAERTWASAIGPAVSIFDQALAANMREHLGVLARMLKHELSRSKPALLA